MPGTLAAPRSSSGSLFLAVAMVGAMLLVSSCAGRGTGSKPDSTPRFRYQAAITVERPTGIGVSWDGRTVYVAGAGGISAFDTSGKPLNSWSLPDGRVPLYVAVTRAGEVVATDTNHSGLWRFSSSGEYLGQISGPAGWQPLGVNVAASGEILVSDVGGEAHSVLILDGQGTVLRQLGQKGIGDGWIEYPNQASIKRGVLYATDGLNGRVLAYDAGGGFRYSIGGLDGARGLAVHDSGLLFVACRSSGDVVVFDVGSQPARFVTRLNTPEDVGAMDAPTGVAIGEGDRLYVADTNRDRVVVWRIVR